eukprot:TRINITY_DN11285_c0_g1_i8.p1 TRINITY_DN11285_c0_g1~~TRINITY_DN11285_c0_g1_i8.p1  ORF type:complete len:176 (-),score=56.49 TRINITY_DN11285_c0_g1_i8:110-637(-)
MLGGNAVPKLSTKWTNCVGLPQATGLRQTAIRCKLEAFVAPSTTPVAIDRDVFSLACSRPGCSIYFEPNQPETASAFWFRYQPNYPDSFKSENVGSPRPFPDVAMLTDGFTSWTASFGLTLQPAQNALEVEVTDATRYMMTQSCCATVQFAYSFNFLTVQPATLALAQPVAADVF